MKRIVPALALAVAASALLSATASAEGGIDDRQRLWGQVNNITPYEWTLVGFSTGLHTDEGSNCFPNKSCWDNDEGPFPQSVLPGQSFVYTLRPFDRESLGAFGGEIDKYDGWVTYKADVLGGPTEYLTIAVYGYRCPGTDSICGLDVKSWSLTAPPDPGFDPLASGGTSVPPKTASPQIAWTQANPYHSDFTFQIQGNWSVDANTTPPRLVDILNAMCDSTQGATCSFTQAGPLTWGIGKPVKGEDSASCEGGGSPPQGGNPPPPLDPNWSELKYSATQSASLTVGGGLSASTEVKLFGVVSSEVTVDVEAEHEWQEEKSFTRTTRVYIPSSYLGTVWVAPTVGTVKGTLVVSNAVARYTILNFGETRSGVTKDALTPAYHVITRVRPLTPEELKERCGTSSGTSSVASLKGSAQAAEAKPAAVRTGSSRGVKPVSSAAAPTGLIPGRGIKPVLLGHTEARVAARLGKPLFKSTTAVDCPVVDPRCKAASAKRGTWVYPTVSLVFGADKRVTTIVYRGRRATARGAGVGTTYHGFIKAHPSARCVKYLAFTNCRFTHKYRGRPVKTVFHFIHKARGRRECDRVMIYSRARSGQEAAS
jgi:hypothetical protein